MRVVQSNTDSSLMLMSSQSHRRETRYLRITYSWYTPVKVRRAGIEAAIAMHASPSFRIAVTDEGTGDGADIIVVIEGWWGWPVGWSVLVLGTRGHHETAEITMRWFNQTCRSRQSRHIHYNRLYTTGYRLLQTTYDRIDDRPQNDDWWLTWYW